jgi:hypothetical protein
MAERGTAADRRFGLTVGWAPGGWIYAAGEGLGALQRIDGPPPPLPGFGPVEGPAGKAWRSAPGLRGRPLGALLARGPLDPAEALALGAALCAAPAPPPPGCADALCVVIDEDGVVNITFDVLGAPVREAEGALRWACGLCLHLLGGPAARPPQGLDEADWQREQAAALWAAVPEPALFQTVAAAIGPPGAPRPDAAVVAAALQAAADRLGGGALGARAAASPPEACAGPEQGAPLHGDHDLEGPTRFVPNLPAAAPTPAPPAEVAPRPPEARGPAPLLVGLAAAAVGAAFVLVLGLVAYQLLGPRLLAADPAERAAVGPEAPPATAPRGDPSALAEPEGEVPEGDGAEQNDAENGDADAGAAGGPAAGGASGAAALAEEEPEPPVDVEAGPAPSSARSQRTRRSPAPAPAPAPAPEPAPAPAPRPEPAAEAPTGRVLVTGDRAKVRLVSGGASHGPGVVPVGSYELRVSFDGGAPVAAGRVEVRAGQTVTVACRAGLQRCTTR